MDLDLATNLMGSLLAVGLVAIIATHAVPSLRELVAPNRLQIAAVVAVAAMASSLYLSGIADLIPCRLCWWQRIFMYPLAIILTIAAVRKDESVRIYAWPLVVIGGLISARHVWLQEFPDDGGTCELSAPCTAKLVDVFGFLTIPAMTGLSFLLLVLVLALPRAGAIASGDDAIEES